MNTIKTILITAAGTAILCIATVSYAALRAANGEMTVVAPAQPATVTVTRQEAAEAAISSVPLQPVEQPDRDTEDQRITDLELRVSALEAKVK